MRACMYTRIYVKLFVIFHFFDIMINLIFINYIVYTLEKIII